MKTISAPTENERTVTGMDEYREREAAIRALTLNDCDSAGAKMAICDLPAADVATVRHGRWICIRKGYGEYECSVCHGVDSDCSDYYGTHVVTEQGYCPNCGSRMDGDDDE